MPLEPAEDTRARPARQGVRTLVSSMDTEGRSPDQRRDGHTVWRPRNGERVKVRAHVPRWGGQVGTVCHIGPLTTTRPVKVRFPDGDERDFTLDELAPADHVREDLPR